MPIPSTIYPPGLSRSRRGGRALALLLTLLTVCGWPGAAQAQSSPCVISVTPAAPQTFSAVGASVSNLPPSRAPYTFDWGDGSATPFTDAQAASVVKAAPYSTSGNRTLSVTQGAAVYCTRPLSVTAAPISFDATPGSGLVGDTFSVQVSGLPYTSFYTLNWGDGSAPVQVTAPGSSSYTHVYAAPGTYGVSFGGPGGAPQTRVIVVASATPPSLSVSPQAVSIGDAVTATSANTAPGDTLDWGDGTAPLPAAPSLSHGYALPGSFTVRLLRGTVPLAVQAVRVTVPAPTLSVTPASASVGQPLTASLGNLTAGIAYSLDWADGTVESVTGSGTVGRTHAYSGPSTYAVKLSASGAAPAIQTVSVTLPPVSLSVVPSAISPGDDVTATVSGASKGVTYFLDFADGSAPQQLHGDDAYSVKHVYAGAGVFVLKVGVVAGSAVQATATVTVNAAIPGLEVSPVAGLVGQIVLAKPSNTRAAQTYTLDWGDGSAPLVFGGGMNVGVAGNVGHTYAATGTFQVRLSTPGVPPVVVPVVMTYGCVLAQISGSVQAGQPAGFTLGGQPGTGVTTGLVGFPAGTAYTLDWGDGALQSGSAGGTSQALGHTFGKVGPSVLRVTVGGQTLCTLAINVEVPPATLSIDAQRAGTPSVITLSGLVNDPGLNYTLDFGDAGPPQQVGATQPNVPHVYAQAGSYPVRLSLSTGGTRLLATGVAVIPAAYGTLNVQTEVRSAAKPGQPISAIGTLAPAPVQLPQNVQAASVVSVTAQGSGPLTLRWNWTPVAAANVSSAPPSVVLDTRTVTLVPGLNTLALPLSTAQAGAFILKVEVLGNPASPAGTVPQVFVQTVTIAAVPPAYLLVGPDGDQFRFRVGQLTFKDDAHPQAPKSFDPANFWAELTLDSPVVVGSLPVALTVLPGERLKITVNGDTATLTGGTVQASTTSGKAGAAVFGEKSQSSNPAYALPALAPMELKIGVVSFRPAGATLDGAIITSPEYSQINVSDWLKSLLSKLLQEKAGGTKPGSGDPAGVKQKLIDPIFDPYESWVPGATPGELPGLKLDIGVQKQGLRSGVNLLAAGRPLPGQEPLARLTANVVKPANLTATGNGYGVYKGAAVLEQAAAAGVRLDYGVNDKAGKPLTDGAVLAGGQVFNPQKNGHFDLASVLGGPIDVSQLQLVVGSDQHDFLNFPELYLNTHGGLVSAQVVGGVSQASLPTAAGYAGGNQKLGSDSGVSMAVASKPVVYLDLNPELSVQPQGYQSGNGDQASLLRQTYSGAPALVKVPDVGPAWQGLLWLSSNLEVTSVLDSGKASKAGTITTDFNVNLKVAAPVSFGLGGWNFNIDGDTADSPPGTVGGWAYRANHIAASMVRSNLIRSVRRGDLGPLAFVGGTVSAVVDGPDVTVEDTGLSRAFGPDGSFTATHIDYKQEGTGDSAIGVFTLSGATFDLSRIGAGLALKCSALKIAPNLANLSYSECDYTAANGERTVAGTRMNVSGMALQKLEAGTPGYSKKVGSLQGGLVFTGDMLVGDTEGAPITAPSATLTLAADEGNSALTLNTPAVEGFGVKGVKGNGSGLLLSLPAGSNDLTGTGIAGIGAGGAGEANRELSFDTGSLVVGDNLTMSVKGTFGRQGGSYWYVLATGKLKPCATVLDVLNVCELYGGLAYNMNWGGGAAGTAQFSALANKPVRDNSGLHLAAGVVGNIVDDTTVNVKGIVLINPAQLSLDFGGDVYLLKKIGDKVNGRFAGTLSTDGFVLNACIGPVSLAAPGGGTLNCGDLEKLNLASVLYIQGAAKIAVGYGGHKYLYLGTYRPEGRISADVDLKVAKLVVNGYVMIGDLPTGADALPLIPGLVPGFGVAAGAAVDYVYHEGGSESVIFCTAKWHFDAHLYAAVDAVMTISPAQLGGQLGGHLALGASASVGGSLCGVGGSVSAGIAVDATFLLTPSAGNVDGNAHVDISLPVVPDVHGDFGVHVKVY
ncbi:PKD domain-containing protein [Deinococcus sp.]|uniref:PKD domain-containing protein n=1 Tax=Deinococcus sp. TaxID=47478 RepID=UPI003C7CF56A